MNNPWNVFLVCFCLVICCLIIATNIHTNNLIDPVAQRIQAVEYDNSSNYRSTVQKIVDDSKCKPDTIVVHDTVYVIQLPKENSIAKN